MKTIRIWEKQKQIIMGVVFASVIVFVFLFLYFFRMQQNTLGNTVVNHFEKEYVMITEENDSQFWKSVYESAREEAEKNNAYLEKMGKDQSSTYSMADYIKIAIASDVDGILIHPDGSVEVMKQMQAAASAGIPVVTLVEDETDSGRISCIGLNAYQLGQIYADVIVDYIDTETKSIEILLDEKDSATNDIIFNQMKSMIRDYVGENQSVDISSRNISEDNTFDTEEAIRNVFIESNSLPDIIVCLSDVDTQAVCQAVVDYNQVGNVSIVGYYTSDTVLSAIDKNIVEATIALDTTQIGKEGIEALIEYQNTGYVSEYTSINLSVVTKRNIMQYMGE